VARARPPRLGAPPAAPKLLPRPSHSGYITYHGRRFLTKLVHRRAGLPSVTSHTDWIAPALRLSGRFNGVLTSRRYITYGPARSVCVGPAALFQGLIRGQLIE